MLEIKCLGPQSVLYKVLIVLLLNSPLPGKRRELCGRSVTFFIEETIVSGLHSNIFPVQHGEDTITWLTSQPQQLSVKYYYYRHTRQTYSTNKEMVSSKHTRRSALQHVHHMT